MNMESHYKEASWMIAKAIQG